MNEFLNVIKNHYMDFQGRAPRRSFWMFVLFYILALLATSIIDYATGMTFGGIDGEQNGVLTTLLTLALFLPMLSLYVRRLHDLGHSGWWVLLGFVPIVNLLMLIYMAFDSQEGPNEYGPNPKGIGNTPKNDVSPPSTQQPPHDTFVA